MSQLPTFMSGANLTIVIDGIEIAYCEALNFSDNMANTMVYGIGSYGPHAIEPLQYSAQGSLRIIRYSDTVKGDFQKKEGKPDNISEDKNKTKAKSDSSEGNSLAASSQQFSPANLLLTSTYDIYVYERGKDDNMKTASFILKDCRTTALSCSFTPGQTVSEDYQFLCRLVQDAAAEPNKKNTGVS